MVGHGLRRIREDEEINVRRSRRVRFALPEDVQPDAGDDRSIFLGDSEFYGIAKEATMGIGIKSTFKDLGLEVEVQVKMDSSVARNISSRRGAGRDRYVKVRELWAQERVRGGELPIIREPGEDDVADGVTKHVEGSRMEMATGEVRVCEA